MAEKMEVNKGGDNTKFEKLKHILIEPSSNSNH